MNKTYPVSKKRESKYHKTVSILDSWESYEGPLDKQKYVALLEDYFSEVMNEVIENRYKYKFPRIGGILRIRKYKNKSNLNAAMPDWAKSKELGKIVYHLNLHTNRHFFKFFWNKSKCRLTRNRTLYDFAPLRINQRSLAKHIKKCAEDPLLKDYDALS